MKNRHLLASRSRDDGLFTEMRGKLLGFLESAHKDNWQPNEKYRRFYVFGDYITCVKWNDQFFITAPDIFKVQAALYKFEHKTQPPLKRKFEESILTQLRCLQEKDGVRIEESSSPFIAHLYSIGAIRTRKRQKIFRWDSINHEALLKSKRSCARANVRSAPKRTKFVMTEIKIFKQTDAPGMCDLMKAISQVEVDNLGEENSSEDSFAV